MPSSSHQSWNSDPVNLPLSVIILFGTPNLTTISWKNSFAFAAVILATGLASIHLVNLSMAIKRCVKPSQHSEDSRLKDLDRLEKVRNITTIQSTKYLQDSRRC